MTIYIYAIYIVHAAAMTHECVSVIRLEFIRKFYLKSIRSPRVLRVGKTATCSSSLSNSL